MAAQRAAKLIKAGKSEEGVEVLQEALLDDPRAARIHLELAIALHESAEDYVGAVYHYRQYLELRPDSQKRRMIEDRISAATSSLIGRAAGVDSDIARRLDDWGKKNATLLERNRQLESELDRVRKTRRIDADGPASNEISGAEASTTVTQHGGFRHYTVKRGDSLSSIAMKMYKDHNKWEQIYEANRKELEDSNDLKIGQVLVIP